MAGLSFTLCPPTCGGLPRTISAYVDSARARKKASAPESVVGVVTTTGVWTAPAFRGCVGVPNPLPRSSFKGAYPS
eukprot:scaffold107516_cov29-Tisochrysis_lutea.AAC.4